MKRAPLLLALSLSAACLPASAEPAAAPAQDVPAAKLESRSFYDDWLADRLALGLRISHATLTDGKRPANYKQDFIGAINKLDDDDEISILPELRYWAARNLLLTLGMDHVAGRTRNFNTSNHHSDGTATMDGPVLLVEGLLPLLDDTLLLHAGPGIAYDFGDFDHVTWWRLGYSDEAGWRQSGSPKSGARGHLREIQVDDAFGLVLSAGVAWRPIERMEIDVSVRHTWIEPDVRWGYVGRRGLDEQQKGEFTLDHLSVSAMLSWVF